MEYGTPAMIRERIMCCYRQRLECTATEPHGDTIGGVSYEYDGDAKRWRWFWWCWADD